MTAAAIAHLRVLLDDVEPTVLRRLLVPVTVRLDRLHRVVQAAMGWMDQQPPLRNPRRRRRLGRA